MATIAPTGTAMRPATSNASNHGMPCPTFICEKATAPMAANAAWHSETCPDVRTSRPSERIKSAEHRPVVKYGSLVPTICGTSNNGTSTNAAIAIRTRDGARY